MIAAVPIAGLTLRQAGGVKGAEVADWSSAAPFKLSPPPAGVLTPWTATRAP